MADVILTDAEWKRIKAVIEQAQAARNHFDWLTSTALRITREHIQIGGLRMALDAIADLDLENVRSREPEKKSKPVRKANGVSQRARTRTTQK